MTYAAAPARPGWAGKGGAEWIRKRNDGQLPLILLAGLRNASRVSRPSGVKLLGAHIFFWLSLVGPGQQ